MPRFALLFAILGPMLAAAVNVWTRIHDQPAFAAADRIWEPIVWEATSALVTLVLIPLVWRAVVAVEHHADRLPAAIGRALGYAAAFFVLHVCGFVLLRRLAYAVTGQAYVFGGVAAWVYELPKDLVTFVILAAVLLAGKRLARAPEPAMAPPPPRPERLTIKDGTRTFLILPEEIMAANASGNYVEYLLADGRRPLARSRFAEAEALLAGHGFLRTHRSWLVNAAHVREVRPLGNGDHELLVGADLHVPVSRRFASGAIPAIRPRI